MLCNPLKTSNLYLAMRVLVVFRGSALAEPRKTAFILVYDSCFVLRVIVDSMAEME